MRPDTIQKLTDQLKRHEGLRLEAYRDSEGILTVGYGHNLEARPYRGVARPGDRITRDVADALLLEDLARCAWDFRDRLPWAYGLNEARQAVLINMLFNLGTGRLLGFKKALAAMRAGDFALAAREMLDSRWAMQVGHRARELAAQMESGEWQS